MSTKTEATNANDVVKLEVPGYSRDSRLVDESQTLVVGQVVKEGPEKRLQALSANANEVQTVGITGTLTAGTFALTFVDLNGAVKTTDPIAFDAITSAIQTGVDTALGASKVVVGGTAITAMTFTFSGAGYALLPQTPIVVDGSDLTGEEDITVTRTTHGGGSAPAAGTTAVQTVAITASAGTYTLTFIDKNGASVTTGVIALTDNTAAVNVILDAALSAGDVVAGGTVHTAMTLTFSGDSYKNRPQPLAVLGLDLLTYTAQSIVHTTVGSSGGTSGPVGIVLAAVTTASGAKTTKVATLVRHAVVNKAYLTVGTANLEDTVEQLTALGIVVRDEDGAALTGA